MIKLNPCRECPYKKNSAPGYLSECSHDPLRFLTQLDDISHPCHLSVDWENEDYSNAQICQGALQFMKNTAKLPRNRFLAEALRRLNVDTREVFATRQQFIDHHSKH